MQNPTSQSDSASHSPSASSSAAPPSPASQNIDKVARLAREAHRHRTLSTRIGSAITGGIGTFASVVVHLSIIIAWCVYNSGRIRGVTPFDPFPYALLTLIVSMEGVLITLFILLTQNRMSREADLREHLNLQMGILIEQEVTAVLTVVRRLAEKHQALDTQQLEIDQLTQATDIEQLATEVEEKLQGE